jgi:hypothetical protein
MVLDVATLESPVAYAVTPALREWYTEGDEEELEYAATTAAARASLRRLAGSDGPARRVVLAVDVPDGAARPAPDVDRAAVRLAGPVDLGQVVSALVDDPAAAGEVAAAASALGAAEAGDEDAAFLVDSVEDHELGWYAAQELPALVALET